MKKCSNPKCGQIKLLTEFNKDRSKLDGYHPRCRACRKIYNAEAKEKTAIYKNNYYQEHKEDAIQYYQENKERALNRQADYLSKNRELVNSQKCLYAKRYPGKVNAHTAKRRAQKKKATPKWLTKDHWQQIEDFYIEAARLTRVTRIPHEVDHIIPFKGKIVTGLHVPWNLQILTKSENSSKNNKVFV